MKVANPLNTLSAYSSWGLLLIRLAFGFQLIMGTQDNVFSWERMLEFRDFLEAQGMPYPLLAAHVSVYAQFGAGILWVLGLFTRWAALVMVINFIVALLLVHVGLPYEQNILAINLLAVSCCLLLTGPGRLSLDARLLRQPSSKEAILAP
ncbi:DoxX family protein [Cesiribacter andamanensis]|uniref:DoxX n=1 Tax=Cesiribacter andamanensis AMV16 TaxID=1279009 RepID=M7NBU9_9BACT|nr:DoxX family protein [Cesiribacter andamanensis]EMR04722.1 DoxX [Cesiribacter andamanensis AMV16]